MSKNFKKMNDLEIVARVIDEAKAAINDKTRTILNSPISDVIAGAVGAGTGGAISFAALFFGGKVVGLSAAGITSGLAAAGKVVGGGMVAGTFVLAAPILLLGGGGILAVGLYKRRKLKQEKERLLQEATKMHHAIVQALKYEVNAAKERADYLNGLNILLQAAINDLKADLGVAA